jgi:hypothetical protein
MYASPTEASRKATLRMIATSFAAGAGLMVIAGLAVPLTSMGMLSVRGAEASEREVHTQLIEPLNVEAVRAQIAAADQTMQAARATTDDDIARLSRLVRR